MAAIEEDAPAHAVAAWAARPHEIAHCLVRAASGRERKVVLELGGRLAGHRRVLDQRRGASGPQDDESGLHLCFSAPTRRSVDAFHAAALAAGGRDNGAPGVRADYSANYYAAFVVDPDGYRIEAYCGRAEP